jgi:hypothetical protein
MRKIERKFIKYVIYQTCMSTINNNNNNTYNFARDIALMELAEEFYEAYHHPVKVTSGTYNNDLSSELSIIIKDIKDISTWTNATDEEIESIKEHVRNVTSLSVNTLLPIRTEMDPDSFHMLRPYTEQYKDCKILFSFFATLDNETPALIVFEQDIFRALIY